MKKKYKLYIGLLAFLVEIIGTVNADNSHAHFAGEAFADINHSVNMPEEWKQAKVDHGKNYPNHDLVIALDQQLYPALKPMIDTWAKAKNIKVGIKEGTCGISYKMIKQKVADIGGFCCPAGMNDRFPGLKFHTLGIAPIVLLTHPENPVENISLNDARKVFTGDIKTWSEIPGTANQKNEFIQSLQPVTRQHCKSRPGHWRLLVGSPDHFSSRIIDVGSIADVISQTAGGKGVLSYEVQWQVLHFRNNGEVKELSIDNESANDRSALLANRYPLYRVYNITTWEDQHTRNPLAQELVQMLLTKVKSLPSEFSILPHEELRQAGWKFRENELIGEPNDSVASTK